MNREKQDMMQCMYMNMKYCFFISCAVNLFLSTPTPLSCSRTRAIIYYGSMTSPLLFASLKLVQHTFLELKGNRFMLLTTHSTRHREGVHEKEKETDSIGFIHSFCSD